MSVMILIHWIQKRLQALEPQVGLLSHSALLGNSQAKISWGYSCLYLQTKKLTIFQYPLVLDPVYFVMSELINLISTWTINKILVPFYKYALNAQINLWQLYISVSVRGGLTLDEGIYIAQIVAQTGDFVFEMSVLCIACGFSFVMVIIFSWFKAGGLVSQWIMHYTQSVLFTKISLPHSKVLWFDLITHLPPLTNPSGNFSFGTVINVHPRNL